MQASTIIVDEKEYPVLELPGRPKALLGHTLAKIYDVAIGQIDKAIDNDPDKFSADFYFELTAEEARSLSENKIFAFDWRDGYLPRGFTYIGANVLAMALRSELGIKRAVQIIMAFARLENPNPGPSKIVETLSAQSKVITVLADEMYRNRRRIDKHEERIKEHQRQLETHDFRINYITRQLTFEDMGLSESEDFRQSLPVISANQARQLREIVKIKGQTKKRMLRIWSLFKQQFDVTRYVHLPSTKYEQAREWLTKLAV